MGFEDTVGESIDTRWLRVQGKNRKPIRLKFGLKWRCRGVYAARRPRTSVVSRLPTLSLRIILPFLEMNYGFEPLRSLRVLSVVQIHFSEMGNHVVSPWRSRIMVPLGNFLVSGRVGSRRRVGVATARGQKRGRDVERIEID